MAQTPPPATATEPPEHWFGLEGAATIKTSSYLEAQLAADYAAKSHTINLIYGDPGTGKSLASRDAYRRIEGDGLPAAWVEYRQYATIKDIALGLLKSISGVEEHGPLRHVQTVLVEALAAREQLVIVDETQRLRHGGIEYLRYLHDMPDLRFGLLLVGGHGCWEVISRYPMLESRILIRVRFEPLSLAETLKVIPGYHSIYASADRDLLAEVHRVSTHGVFRAWAGFTKLAVDACQNLELDTLTEDVARIVFRLLAKGAT